MGPVPSKGTSTQKDSHEDRMERGIEVLIDIELSSISPGSRQTHLIDLL